MRKLLIMGLLVTAGVMVCRGDEPEKIPLQGGLRWTEDVSDLVFQLGWGSYEPKWEFTEEAYNQELRYYYDYRVYWSDTRYPGTATLEVRGEGNYTGSLFLTFEIKKAPEVPTSSSRSHYSWWRNSHRVYYCEGFEAQEPFYITSITDADKRVEPVISYRAKDSEDELSTGLPRENGTYEVWVYWPECELYYATGPYYTGDFTVFDYTAQWAALREIKEELISMVPEGIDPLPMRKWDLDKGPYEITSYEWGQEFAADGSIIGLNLAELNLHGTFPKSVLKLPGLKNLRLYNWNYHTENLNELSGKLDDILAEAAAEGLPAFETLEYLDIDALDYSGNIGRVASFFPNLQRFECQRNRFTDVHPMVNPDINLSYNHQRLDSVIHINASHPDEAAIIAATPEICKYHHRNQTLDDHFGCNFRAYQHDWDYVPNSPITRWDRASFRYNNYHNPETGNYDLWKFETTGSWRDAVYYGYNGQEFVCEQFSNDSYYYLANDMRMVISYDDYDCNLTEGFNVGDVQATISYMQDLYFPRFVYNFSEGDVVKDGTINVQDVALLITKLLEKEEPAAPAQMRALKKGESMFYVDESGRMCLSTAEPASAFEITVRGINIPRKIEALDRLGMTYRVAEGDDYSRLVVYTFNEDRNIPAGVLRLFPADGASYLRGMATDADGRRLTKPYDTTDEEAIDIDTLPDEQLLSLNGSTLSFSNAALTGLSWRVISTQGREVARGTAANVDLSHLATGVYIVVVEAEGISPRSIKIIIK